MGTDEITEKEVGLIDSALAVLMEHFDAVQIFASRHNGDSTYFAARGMGSFYSRYGQVKHWLLREEAASIQESLDDDE